MKICSLLLFILLSAKSFGAAEVSAWDAAAEFNDSANPDAMNPSGVWSYGWKETLTGRFFLALTSYNDPPNLSGWSSASGFPGIAHLSRIITTTVGVNPVSMPAGTLLLHPGPNGEYAVLRFTAPSDGSYQLSGRFSSQDDYSLGTGTTTDVWVSPNGTKTSVFFGNINYRAGLRSASFTGRVTQLRKGDTLDFEVGYGSNKNFDYDCTGLLVLIEKIK